MLFADYAVHLRSCLLYQRMHGPATQWAFDPFLMAG